MGTVEETRLCAAFSCPVSVSCLVGPSRHWFINLASYKYVLQSDKARRKGLQAQGLLDQLYVQETLSRKLPSIPVA